MATKGFTEEEQTRYDRQIRLWGVEAQQRMRSATILVARLKGTATEVIKNIVLAGIGKLIVVDDEEVLPEDLGAGFFFRDEDVGKKRVDAAKTRIESLNPLVAVETKSSLSVFDAQSVNATLQGVDLVCMTEWPRDDLIRINEACRAMGKPFYAGGTYGVLGYIFCDLLEHEYITPDRSAPKDAPRNLKAMAKYPPLKDALQFKWSNLTKRQTKELNPAPTLTILSIWEYQAIHQGALPDDPSHTAEMLSIASTVFASADVNKQVLPQVPQETIETLTMTAAHEFSPVCAIVGGMLAQDILKTLAAKEPPIANFFVFDGNTGGGTVCRMNMD